MSDREIDEILDTFYKNSFPQTKKVARRGYRLFGKNFKISRFIIYKNDLINDYIKSRSIPTIDGIIYDFSLVPNRINGVKDKFTIICKNKIGNIEIGKFVTNYHNLVKLKKDHPYFGCNKSKQNLFNNVTNSKLIKFIKPDKTTFIINQIDKFYNKKFDTSEVEYTNSRTPIKLTCKHCGYVFWIKPGKINSLGKELCTQCKNLKITNNRKLTKEELINRSESIFGKNAFDYSNLTITSGIKNKITIKCNRCGSTFSIWARDHLKSPTGGCKIYHHFGTKFPKNYNILGNFEKFQLFIDSIYGKDEIIVSKFDTKSITDIYKDTVNIFITSSNEYKDVVIIILLRGNLKFKRNHCKSSGEKLIEFWLKSNKINFRSEVEVKNIEGRNSMRVLIDFVLEFSNEIFWIEYNGQQHYSDIDFFRGKDKNSFQKQVKRDNNVKTYCKMNNIKLIEIPYTISDYPTLSNILHQIIFEGKSPEDLIKLPKLENSL